MTIQVRPLLRHALFAALLAVAAVAVAQAPPPPPPQGARAPEPERSSGRPEYTVRNLPSDTFNPSEEVSEDTVVPFPADI